MRAWTGLVAAGTALAACASPASRPDAPTRYDLGRTATTVEVAARDVDIGPDGAGLPAGSGSAAQGQALFLRQCAACHGANGEGMKPLYPALIGRDSIAENFRFGAMPGLPRTIGNYWPYATTVFDYIRRAMPPAAPRSLSDADVYALTAYLLVANRIIASDVRLDSAKLAAVRMPYRDRFVPDSRSGARTVR